MPNLYVVTFNKHEELDGKKYAVDEGGNKKFLNDKGEFLVEHENLKAAEKFGGGFKTREFLGVLNIDEFKGEHSFSTSLDTNRSIHFFHK